MHLNIVYNYLHDVYDESKEIFLCDEGLIGGFVLRELGKKIWVGPSLI